MGELVDVDLIGDVFYEPSSLLPSQGVPDSVFLDVVASCEIIRPQNW
jgi:hypothetical protein